MEATTWDVVSSFVFLLLGAWVIITCLCFACAHDDKKKNRRLK